MAIQQKLLSPSFSWTMRISYTRGKNPKHILPFCLFFLCAVFALLSSICLAVKQTHESGSPQVSQPGEDEVESSDWRALQTIGSLSLDNNVMASISFRIPSRKCWKVSVFLRHFAQTGLEITHLRLGRWLQFCANNESAWCVTGVLWKLKKSIIACLEWNRTTCPSCDLCTKSILDLGPANPKPQLLEIAFPSF